MASSRCRPFRLTFHPNGPGKDSGPYKSRVVPVNSAPVDIENEYFRGRALLIHDTGSEPGATTNDDGSPAGGQTGIGLQIQCRFKEAVVRRGLSPENLWAGGELLSTPQLGWITKQVVELCIKYARWVSNGLVHFFLPAVDDESARPHLSFPLGYLFTCHRSPPGAEPPLLGSRELLDAEGLDISKMEINLDDVYTFVFQTTYLDLFSWELLNIPGISPLPIENVLGDIYGAEVMLFDLAACGGVHADWNNGVVLHWEFARCAEGEDVEEAPTEEASTRLADTGSESAESLGNIESFGCQEGTLRIWHFATGFGIAGMLVVQSAWATSQQSSL